MRLPPGHRRGHDAGRQWIPEDWFGPRVLHRSHLAKTLPRGAYAPGNSRTGAVAARGAYGCAGGCRTAQTGDAVAGFAELDSKITRLILLS